MSADAGQPERIGRRIGKRRLFAWLLAAVVALAAGTYAGTSLIAARMRAVTQEHDARDAPLVAALGFAVAMSDPQLRDEDVQVAHAEATVAAPAPEHRADRGVGP